MSLMSDLNKSFYYVWIVPKSNPNGEKHRELLWFNSSYVNSYDYIETLIDSDYFVVQVEKAPL